MLPNAIRHMDAEDIERYSMGDISEELCAQFEEHLLICETCRIRVAESDEFIRSVRRAGKQIRREGTMRSRSVWRGWPTFVAAGALIAAGVVFGLMHGRARPEFTVRLAAMRGAEMLAKAPVGAPLVLDPDLTGLPPAASYRLEMVDAFGKTVWRGAFPGAQVPARPAGLYFVRVSSAGGELLREYGLEVR
jgi:hypothetical protein